MLTVFRYLQKKLPLDSQFLGDVTCLNTRKCTGDWTVNAIARIAQCLSHVLSTRQIDIVRDKWKLYRVDKVVKSEWLEESQTGRIDAFWKKMFVVISGSGEKCATLKKVVKSFFVCKMAMLILSAAGHSTKMF